MKKLLRPVYAGISGKLDQDSNKYKFVVDFDNNTKDDVVKFIEPYFHQSNIDGNTYWFGYSFNDGQLNPRRDEFIEFMKHVQPHNWSDPNDEWSEPNYNDESITEPELSEMLFRSLNRIHLSDRSIDAIVYPESKSGNLVSMLVKIIRQAMPSKPRIKTAELLKASPSNITFDYDSFHEDIESGDLVVPEFVTDNYIREMIDNIHNSDSFSLRRNIRPVSLRPYVSGFYDHSNIEGRLSDADVALVVDDFGTSGTTIREIIRSIRKVNNECEIYIFTLLGNKRIK